MKKHVSFLVAISFIALALLSCGTQNNNTGTTDDVKVSFESFNPRSISVKNNTGERLIAFKGAIELSSLISGVPAYASNHGLRMDPNLFAETGDFALLFVTEKMFNENKNNLEAIRNKPFASLYAFYNKTGSNGLTYTISSISGGDKNFTLHNNSAFNVEIRMNSPEGEVIGYVAAYTTNTVIKMSQGDYTLYPIFKKYIARENEIYSIVPKFTASKKPFSRDFGITDDTSSWNVAEVWDPSALKLSSGGFYLTVNNQANADVRFRQGSTDYSTSLGIKSIKSGMQETFFIPFQKIDGSYPDSFKISTLTIGSAAFPNTLPEFTYELDKKYMITVKGAQQDSLTLEPIVDKGAVDINGLFGF
ncbi:MAG: hypothetical protein ACTTIZ_08885 [Treponema sp.]